MMPRACPHCGEPVPSRRRVDARYCNGGCRAAASRARAAEAHSALLTPDEFVVAVLCEFPGSTVESVESEEQPLELCRCAGQAGYWAGACSCLYRKEAAWSAHPMPSMVSGLQLRPARPRRTAWPRALTERSSTLTRPRKRSGRACAGRKERPAGR